MLGTGTRERRLGDVPGRGVAWGMRPWHTVRVRLPGPQARREDVASTPSACGAPASPPRHVRDAGSASLSTYSAPGTAPESPRNARLRLPATTVVSPGCGEENQGLELKRLPWRPDRRGERSAQGSALGLPGVSARRVFWTNSFFGSVMWVVGSDANILGRRSLSGASGRSCEGFLPREQMSRA